MAGIGLENRTSILPTPSIQKGPGIFGPDYSFADNIKLPGEVGVRDGDSLNDVTDAVKAVGYYIDTIGFGQSSSSLTKDMDIRPLGVNYWMRTGMICSNGAEMWQYVDGIPRGDAIGERVDKGLQSAGLPRLRGLAPGIIEDAKSALNPVPVLEAVFGSGYPECRYEVKSVGDSFGKTKNSDGVSYVENPETVQSGKQGRWVYSQSLTKDMYDKTPKTHCPDGFPKKNHRDFNCSDRLLSTNMEGFIAEHSKSSQGSENESLQKGLLVGLIVGSSLLMLKYLC